MANELKTAREVAEELLRYGDMPVRTAIDDGLEVLRSDYAEGVHVQLADGVVQVVGYIGK